MKEAVPVIVICPACYSKFAVSAEEIGPLGRKVRCSLCHYGWHQEAEMAIAAGVEVAEKLLARSPFATLVDDQTRSESLVSDDRISQDERSSFSVKRIALLALAALLVVVPAALYLWKDEIAARFPYSRKIYSDMGLSLTASETGLEIANLTKKEYRLDGRKVADLSGVVFNASMVSMKLPPLAIRFVDANGKVLKEGAPFYFPRPTIDAGETLPFHLRESEMPEGAAVFDVKFVSPE